MKLQMKTDFWIEKWQNQQTGFHKNYTHPLLIKFLNKLELQLGDTVFVPLCGKSVDMLWLNLQGYNVIGVEVSELAVEQFFSENQIAPKRTTIENFNVFTYENITIYQGDFFELSSEHLKNVSAIYDRAALIALPNELVVKYVDKMHHILPKGTLELLVTLEFNKTFGPVGPPFTTPDTKVVELFSEYPSTQLVYQTDIIEREDKFRGQGCKYVYERVYLVTF